MTIKACFNSRFPYGYLMEVDFSQLEVIALAILSGDEQLTQDLKDGLDMHRKRAAELWSIHEAAVTNEQRTIAKGLSFQLQYGAGYKSMAAKCGISEALAKQFIDLYYKRYPKVKEWQQENIAAVQASRSVTGEHTTSGYPKGVGSLQSLTGREYRFFEYDSSYKKEASFSPTEIKNYPVQGFATGDVMALYRGRVYRRLIAEGVLNEALLINTVHDSVMLDVPNEAMVLFVYGLLKDEADKLPLHLLDLWNINTSLTFPIDCKYGRTWESMTKLTGK